MAEPVSPSERSRPVGGGAGRQTVRALGVTTLGALAGLLLGGALGYGDLVFLAQFINFHVHSGGGGIADLAESYIALGVNAVCGFGAGVLAALFLLRPRSSAARNGGWSIRNAVPGAVVGGALGALIGFVDVFLLSQYLYLSDSDNAAAWRENRSLLVILNASCGAVFGAFVTLIANRRS
jgi:hypothetical protein